MKRDHEGDIRGFYHTGSAYYARTAMRPGEDEINIGMYSPRGGTSGEFCIRWFSLCGETVARLEVFDDGWSALNNFRDLLDTLAGLDSDTPSPAQVCEALLALGITDMTPRRAPK